MQKNSLVIFAFIRKLGNKKLLVVCSLSPSSAMLNLNREQERARLVLSNFKAPKILSGKIKIPPCGCAVWETDELLYKHYKEKAEY